MPYLTGNYYETLGLTLTATPEQIDRAYRYHVSLYSDASLATYSLLEPSERQQARAQVQEAYDVLKDPLRRRAYDLSQGFSTSVTTPSEKEPNSSSPAPVDLKDPVTGAVLRRVREERGISLEKIANKSKIGLRYLQYIEADRHRELPARVYLRGFLLEYARALGLDAGRIADSYLAGMPKLQR
jgi:flagellar biosynthesis protein FlhG